MKQAVDNNENINVAEKGASLFYKLWVGKSCNSNYELNDKNEIIGYSKESEIVEYNMLFEKGELELIDKQFQIKKDSVSFSFDEQTHSFITQNSFGEFFLLATKYPENYIKKFEFDIQSKPDSIVKIKITNITNFLTEEQLGIVKQKVEEEVSENNEEVKENSETKSQILAGKVIDYFYKNLPLIVLNQLEQMNEKQIKFFTVEYGRKRKETGLAYLALCVGLHYFYLKDYATQILFTLTMVLGLYGFVTFRVLSISSPHLLMFASLSIIIPFIWVIIALVRLPKLVKEYNEDVAIDVIKTVKVLS